MGRPFASYLSYECQSPTIWTARSTAPHFGVAPGGSGTYSRVQNAALYPPAAPGDLARL
jgi:hypothetical protein